ncbi:hypothetical protein ACFXG4_08570 [Nocardia sp. NPDC059246]|uniref:hypothetical protein n=1 Tax=unclassified Nocardia TaxID=2637762 RepID=UPI0036A7685E
MFIQPTTGSPSPSDVAADLRALADLAEADSDGFVAGVLARFFAGADAWPAHAANHLFDDEAGRRAAVQEAIRRFATVQHSAPMISEVGSGNDKIRQHHVVMRVLTVKLRELASVMTEDADA